MSDLPEDLKPDGMSADWLAAVRSGEDLSFGPSDQSPFVFAGVTFIAGVAAIVLGFAAGWALLALSAFGTATMFGARGEPNAKQATITQEGVFGNVNGPNAGGSPSDQDTRGGIAWDEASRVAIGSSGTFFKERWVLVGRGDDSIRIPTTRDKTDHLVVLINELITLQRAEE